MMRAIHDRNLWSGVLFVVVGVSFAVGALSYRMGESARPGPGYFPFGLGVLLALVGAVVAGRALLSRSRDPAEHIGGMVWRPLLIVVGSIVLFAALLPRLGMAIALPVLVVSISLAGDEFHWKGVLASALVLTVGAWAVFIQGLDLVIQLWPPFLEG